MAIDSSLSQCRIKELNFKIKENLNYWIFKVSFKEKEPDNAYCEKNLYQIPYAVYWETGKSRWIWAKLALNLNLGLPKSLDC